MNLPAAGVRIMVASRPVDFRDGLDGLAAKQPMSSSSTPTWFATWRSVACLRQTAEAEPVDQGAARLGSEGKTILDPDFDIDDGGLPHEKPAVPGG
jgi:hypothetical protein